MVSTLSQSSGLVIKGSNFSSRLSAAHIVQDATTEERVRAPSALEWDWGGSVAAARVGRCTLARLNDRPAGFTAKAIVPVDNSCSAYNPARPDAGRLVTEATSQHY